MPRRIAIIDGHPDTDSRRFVDALAAAYERGATEAGREVRRITVAALKIPVLRTAKEFQSGTPSAAVRAWQDSLAWAEH